MNTDPPSPETPVLGAAGLKRFQELRNDAIQAVTERFYASHGAVYAQFGPRGREACREDLTFHLEFLRPVLEFGLIQPMSDYLRWLSSVLSARDIPAEHLPLSLDWLAEFFDSRMEGADADIVVIALHRAKAAFVDASRPPPDAHLLATPSWAECEDFENALLSGDRYRAGSLFDSRLARGHSLVDVEVQLIQSALYGIGQKWQHNQVSVAQEHLATAISQSLMTQGLLKSEVPAANDSKILLTCVEDNTHTVGLQMVADAFQLSGWEVEYLGANMPTSVLIEHIGRSRPHLLGLSVSFPQQLRVVKDIMLRLVQSYGVARPAVIIGGLAINQFNRLATELGADAWSPNAHSAVSTVAKMTPPSGSG